MSENFVIGYIWCIGFILMCVIIYKTLFPKEEDEMTDYAKYKHYKLLYKDLFSLVWDEYKREYQIISVVTGDILERYVPILILGSTENREFARKNFVSFCQGYELQKKYEQGLCRKIEVE